LVYTNNFAVLNKDCIFASFLNIIYKTIMSQTALQEIYLNVPQTEVGFITALAKKMGWEIETKEDLLRKYIASRPENVDLSDEEILSEIKEIRYSK
jgi:hypothetical protein